MLDTRTFSIAFAPLLLLLIPLFFNAPWDAFDYIVGGALLTIAGIIYLIIKSLVSKKYRLYALALLFIAFILTWAELAVGLFGTQFAGS